MEPNNLHDDILLEFNTEDGIWHYNFVVNGHPEDRPETNGYHTVARTDSDRADLFCDFVDLHRNYCAKHNLPYPNIEDLRVLWDNYVYKLLNLIKKEVERIHNQKSNQQ